MGRINDEPLQFHHIGILYLIQNIDYSSEEIPEEKTQWLHLSKASFELLTPFAKRAVNSLASQEKV